MSKILKKQKEKAVTNQVLLRAADCARLCGVSKRTWFRLAASARTPVSIRLGASPVWRRKDLDLWISWDCPNRQEYESRKESEKC